MVVHSHPSNKKSHTHTDTQLLVIHRLSTFNTPKVEMNCGIDVERYVLCCLDFNHDIFCTSGTHLEHPSLRAPPVNG